MTKKDYSPKQILADYKKELQQVLKKLGIPYSKFKSQYPHLEEALDSYISEHKVNLAMRGVISEIEKHMAEETESTEEIFRCVKKSPRIDPYSPGYIPYKKGGDNPDPRKKY